MIHISIYNCFCFKHDSFNAIRLARMLKEAFFINLLCPDIAVPSVVDCCNLVSELLICYLLFWCHYSLIVVCLINFFLTAVYAQLLFKLNFITRLLFKNRLRFRFRPVSSILFLWKDLRLPINIQFFLIRFLTVK